MVQYEWLFELTVLPTGLKPLGRVNEQKTPFAECL